MWHFLSKICLISKVWDKYSRCLVPPLHRTSFRSPQRDMPLTVKPFLPVLFVVTHFLLIKIWALKGDIVVRIFCYSIAHMTKEWFPLTSSQVRGHSESIRYVSWYVFPSSSSLGKNERKFWLKFSCELLDWRDAETWGNGIHVLVSK